MCQKPGIILFASNMRNSKKKKLPVQTKKANKSRFKKKKKFMGMKSKARKEQGLNLRIQEYITNLQILLTLYSFEEFRFIRSRLLSRVNCRTDISCAIAKLSQVEDKRFDADSDI